MLGCGSSYLYMNSVIVSAGTTVMRNYGALPNWVSAGISITLEIRSSRILSVSRLLLLIYVY